MRSTGSYVTFLCSLSEDALYFIKFQKKNISQKVSELMSGHILKLIQAHDSIKM